MTLDPKEQVGGVDPVKTDDPLVVLLYLLIRDHLNAGIFEKLVLEMARAEEEGSVALTNPFVAGYAENVAERLRMMAPRGFTLTTEEREGIESCIALASSIGRSYECYGGVEVPEALKAARSALDRLDEELPLPVDDPEKVRLRAADELVRLQSELLKLQTTETSEERRSAYSKAGELVEGAFQRFAPERWVQELEKAERQRKES